MTTGTLRDRDERGFEAGCLSLTGVTLTFRHKYRARARSVLGSVRRLATRGSVLATAGTGGRGQQHHSY